MPKAGLRRTLLRCRSEMDQAAWQSASSLAQQRLMSLEAFSRATCIALYAPIRNEIDTALLFEEARRTGKRVLYPRVYGEEMRFYEVTDATCLEQGAFGILEPCIVGEGCSPDTADLVVVPGVAFDGTGHRIGFGKGYYDRCLSQLDRHPVLVGLCHDFQLLEQVPSEGHDIRMQYIVTDQRTIEAGTDPRMVG